MPSEIDAFGDGHPAFAGAGADVVEVSIDSEYVHLSCSRVNHPDLKHLLFPAPPT
ncbi:MAG TPA: hypothetical protein VGI44_16665 [Acidimicrobiales bacterium]